MALNNPWHATSGLLVLNDGPLAGERADKTAANAYLDEIIRSSRELVVLAEGLSEGDQISELVRALVDACKGHRELTESNGVAVKGTLDNLFGKLLSLSAQNQALTARVRQLENRVRAIEQEQEIARRSSEQAREFVILGQVAYLIDKAAVDYVGVTDRVAHTLKQIAKASQSKQLSISQEERWKEFDKVLRKLGWNERSIASVGTRLKEFRMGVAHGFEDEIDKVTIDDLMHYAEKHVDRKNVQDVQDLITLASKFGEDGRPLRIQPDISKVLRQISESN